VTLAALGSGIGESLAWRDFSGKYDTLYHVILRGRFGFWRRRIPKVPVPGKERTYYVYILTSDSGTLYTGVTNSIFHRTLQHKNKATPGFTSKYGVNRLVYYESFSDVLIAIRREKEIKGWTRKRKMALIESKNPKWEDLAQGWGELLPRQPWQVRDPLADQRRGDSSGPKGKSGPSE